MKAKGCDLTNGAHSSGLLAVTQHQEFPDSVVLPVISCAPRRHAQYTKFFILSLAERMVSK